MKKVLLLVLGFVLVTACAKKYNTIDSQAEATKINAKQEKKASLQNKVFFDLNKATLSEESKNVLDGIADWMASDEAVTITVEGHCDERGTREYNLALGQKRADAVKQYLVSKNIEAKRINTTSFGKEKPEFIGSGESVWAKNRRAVIVDMTK